MYIVKTLSAHATRGIAEQAMRDALGAVYCQELVEVPYPDGKSFEDLEEFRIVDSVLLRYRLKGESVWHELAL